MSQQSTHYKLTLTLSRTKTDYNTVQGVETQCKNLISPVRFEGARAGAMTYSIIASNKINASVARNILATEAKELLATYVENLDTQSRQFNSSSYHSKAAQFFINCCAFEGVEYRYIINNHNLRRAERAALCRILLQMRTQFTNLSYEQLGEICGKSIVTVGKMIADATNTG